MATSQDAVRRLSIQATTSGVTQATAELNKLAQAQGGVAVASATTERATLSLDQKFASIEKRYVATVRAQAEYDKTQRMVNAAVAQNPALQDRANAVMAAAAERLRAVSGAANDNATATGLARHELINLSRQAQDVAVSLAGGQSPLTVLFQQGSQIGDVFATSRGTLSGFFGQVTGWLGSFLTLGRVAFGGLTVAITGAGAALNSYLDSQNKVQMSLLGSGRASGQSVSSINAIAQSGSSLTGFSVTEARAFAAELASTGKIGRENLEPLVKIGHDIASVYGVDASEAAKLLGKAFSDPVSGADRLNERLGFLDAAMQRQIQNLVAQNRQQEAQRVLQAGVSSSLVGVGDAVATTTKFWTALGNAASNAWDKIGAGLSRVTGIGLKLGLDDQIKVAQTRLDSFKKDLETARQYEASLGSDAKSVDTGYGAAIAGVEKYSAEVDRLTAAMNRNADATVEAQARQMSFAQAAGVRSQLPEIDQLAKLRNEQELLVKTMIDVQVSGGPASDILKRMGLSYEDLAKSVAIANGNLSTFKSEFQSQSASLKIANDSLTAFSPSAKGDIARRQSLESTVGSKMDPAEKAALGQQAYDNAVKSVTVSLSEQARARALSANQSIQSAQLDIDLIGKTIGQQAELRANLQARQALEQQASQNRTGFDDAEFARLQKKNAELGRVAQLAATAAVNDNISFGRQTAFLSQEDVQIAQQLKGIYPDVATGLQSVEAQGLRLNNTLRDINDTTRDITRGFASDFRSAIQGGASALDALGVAGANALNKIADKLTNMAIDSLWSKAFGGAGGGIFGLFGLGGSSGVGAAQAASTTGLSLTGTGGLFANGGYTGPGAKYQPAGVVHAGEYVFSQASVGRIGLGNLDRLHRGYADGGPVLPMSTPTNDNGRPAMVINYSPTINAPNSDAQSIARLATVVANDRKNFEKNVEAIVAKSAANKPGFGR